MAEGDRDAEDTKVGRWRSAQLVWVRRRSERRYWPTGDWQREKATAVTSTHQSPVVYTNPLALSSFRVSFMHALSSFGARRVARLEHVGKLRYYLNLHPRLHLGWCSSCAQGSLESDWGRLSATTGMVTAAAALLKLPQCVLYPPIGSRVVIQSIPILKC